MILIKHKSNIEGKQSKYTARIPDEKLHLVNERVKDIAALVSWRASEQGQ